MVADDFALFNTGIMHESLFFQLGADADEAGREIEPGYLLEVPGQLKGRTSGGAADIEGPAARSPAKDSHEVLDATPVELRHPEILFTIVELAVLRDQFIGLIRDVGDYDLCR